MSKPTLPVMDITYFLAFAMSLTDDFIDNDANFSGKNAVVLELPSGNAICINGNIQESLHKLKDSPIDEAKKILSTSYIIEMPNTLTAKFEELKK